MGNLLTSSSNEIQKPSVDIESLVRYHKSSYSEKYTAGIVSEGDSSLKEDIEAVLNINDIQKLRKQNHLLQTAFEKYPLEEQIKNRKLFHAVCANLPSQKYGLLYQKYIINLLGLMEAKGSDDGDAAFEVEPPRHRMSGGGSKRRWRRRGTRQRLKKIKEFIEIKSTIITLDENEKPDIIFNSKLNGRQIRKFESIEHYVFLVVFHYFDGRIKENIYWLNKEQLKTLKMSACHKKAKYRVNGEQPEEGFSYDIISDDCEKLKAYLYSSNTY